MAGKRTASELDDDEGYLSEELDYDSTDKRSRSSTAEITTSYFQHDSPAGKIVYATARVMLGLANRFQTLNKTIISKIIEAENEKGGGLQFKKHVLPGLQKLFEDIFRYEVAGLPSKKTLQPNQISAIKQNQERSFSKNNNADEFILVNNLPPSLRALNYSFLAENTRPIEKSMKEMEAVKTGTEKVMIYGEGLPKPTSNIVQNGIKLLIICIVALHTNNMLQSDLLSVLNKSFGLAFKEREEVSILGDQTLTDFITMLSKQEYLERSLITNKSSTKTSTRVANGKNSKYDDNTLMIRLGRRCLEEWTQEEFINLFRQLMQDQWTEQMHQNAEYTISQIWK